MHVVVYVTCQMSHTHIKCLWGGCVVEDCGWNSGSAEQDSLLPEACVAIDISCVM